jgi:hypothetical protein
MRGLSEHCNYGWAFQEPFLMLIFLMREMREIFVEISRSEMSWKKQQQIALDRSPDYEAFRNNITLDKPIQDPRNEIFASLRANVVEYKTSTNSCPVP